MTTHDPRSLEVRGAAVGDPTELVRELQNLYSTLSDVCATDFQRDERLRAIVTGADLGRAARVPPRPRRRLYVLATLRRWCVAAWAWSGHRPGEPVMTVPGGAVGTGDDIPAERWLELLWQDHRDDVVRYLMRHVRDETAVEDLTQQTFMAAWRQREQIDVDARAWLFGVAKNLVRHHWRRRHRERLKWEAELATAPHASDGGIGGVHLRADVAAAWKKLTLKEQEILLLSVDHDLDDRAIAREQRTTRENVRQRRHRARWKLSEALRDVPT